MKLPEPSCLYRAPGGLHIYPAQTRICTADKSSPHSDTGLCCLLQVLGLHDSIGQLVRCCTAAFSAGTHCMQTSACAGVLMCRSAACRC